MARLLHRFPPATRPRPDTYNRAGFPAYRPVPAEQVLEVLLLGSLGASFYADAQEVAEDAVAVLRHAATTDPEFLARAAVLAREEGYMRSAPLLALLLLLSAPDARSKNLGRRIFDRIVRTADDLRVFVGLALSGRFRAGYGGNARLAAAAWMNAHLNGYQAVKYAGSGERLSLRNILRLTHPVPPDAEREAVYRWLVRGEIAPDTPVPALRALAALTAGTLTPAAAIREGNLPFEAVMPRVPKGDRDVWRALLDRAPYMFLLRSLAAMGRAGVWEDPEAVAGAAKRLEDPAAVQRSRQFPFRFAQALRALRPEQLVVEDPALTRFRSVQGRRALRREPVPDRLCLAVERALELSFDNLPDLGPLHLALAPDVSGSMTRTIIGRDVSAATIAGLFTAALWRRYPDARILPFDATVHALAASPRDTLLTIAAAVSRTGGGGTDLAAPVRSLWSRNAAVDLFVGLTDSEDWAASGGWRGEGFLAAWREYRKRIAPRAQAVLIQLVPSGTRVSPAGEPGVHYVYGWSDAVLRHLSWVTQGGKLVAQVRAMNL